MTDDKYEKILGQVRALIAKADSTDFAAEADLLRAKAEALMLKYRIEEAIVFEKAIGTAEPLEPVWVRLPLYQHGSEYASAYGRIAGSIMAHVGGRGMLTYSGDTVMVEMVGFSSDLRYAEVLLTSCLLEFGARLEPKYDPNKTDAENAWNLRSAGWERKRIARVMFGDWSSENEMKAKNRKVTRLIKEHAEKIGEPWEPLLGRGNNMGTYRDSYADGFVNALWTRLYEMRNTATEMTGGAIVPVSRKEAVDEAYYAKYPSQRPSDKPVRRANADCERCKKAKSGYCRDHAWMKPTSRVVYKSVNGAAQDRGRAAAYNVNLGPSANTGRRIGN